MSLEQNGPKRRSVKELSSLTNKLKKRTDVIFSHEGGDVLVSKLVEAGIVLNIWAMAFEQAPAEVHATYYEREGSVKDFPSLLRGRVKNFRKAAEVLKSV